MAGNVDRDREGVEGRATAVADRRDHAPAGPRSAPMQGSSLATSAPEPDASRTIDALAEVYEFRDDGAVRAFLADHTDLFAVLGEIPRRIADYFPAHERLVLEVFEDPENEAAPPELWALIPGRFKAGEARARLNKMGRDWWLEGFLPHGGRLYVDIVFL